MASHPLQSRHRLKLGTFGSNIGGGAAIMCSVDGALEATWPSTLQLARLADVMEFEILLPIARWRGYGGPSNFHGSSFEPFTWAAAIGASTTSSCVFATTHVGTVHPIVAAKQAATIDHVTDGRFGLNVVAGWYSAEMEMFGLSLPDHAARYAQAAEWLQIVKRLWSEEAPFDHEGTHYRIKRGLVRPRPLQTPFPPVMNAGGSDNGREFAARYCDIAFIATGGLDLGQIHQRVESYRETARQFGRTINVWTYGFVVQGETMQQAQTYLDHCINQHGDWEAAASLASVLGMNATTMQPQDLQQAKLALISGWGGFPLIGSRDHIVDQLLKLTGAGIDGIALSWPRYLSDMTDFSVATYPLLRQAGLR